MKIRIIALCLVCAIISGLAVGCAHLDNTAKIEPVSAQQELPPEGSITLPASEPQSATMQPAATQPVKKQSRNDSSVPANKVLKPQENDFDTLEEIISGFSVYRNPYDCEKDSALEIFARWLAVAGHPNNDPYALIREGDDCYFHFDDNYSEHEHTANWPKENAFAPHQRLKTQCYCAIREEILLYYKENIFNNYLPLEEEYCYTENNGETNCLAYSENGWYYFSVGMGESLFYCKYTSYTPMETGHYLIGMESRCTVDDKLEYTATIDATLIEKDGLRLWKIFKITSESCW